MKKKHSLVVGGTRGIGRILVKKLAQECQTVSVIGRRAPSETDLHNIANVYYSVVDLLDREHLYQILADIISQNGKLSNVIFCQRYKGEKDDWTKQIEVSLTATKNVIDSLKNLFIDEGEKSIVIVSSAAGHFIAEEQPLSYHVAKAGINQMVRFYAVALGDRGIRVNCVSSGAVIKEESKEFYHQNEELHSLYKKITPLGRMATSEDIANVVEFLCSSKASFITGQNIVVDGGISLQWHESLARQLTPLNNLSVSTKRKEQKMSKSIFRRDTCRLCGSHELQLVLPFVPTPVGDDYIASDRLNEIQDVYPIDLFLCHNCGLVQLLDVIDPEVLYKNFIYTTSVSLGLVEHFQKYAEDVIQWVCPPSEGFVVDVGSNDGTVLRCFQKKGLRVLGIEPAVEISRKATESGVETLPVFFNSAVGIQIREERGVANIITSNNTFANIDNLKDMFAGVRELLAPDGVFVFETGYIVDLLQKGIFDYIYHEHLSYFSVKPLESFFRENGMELIDIDRVSPKGGSLRGFVQLAGGLRPVSPSVKKLIELETSLGVDRAEPFIALGARISEIKQQLIALLKNLKAQGKTIAGYGASVGVTTFLYLFELGDLLTFIVDDNPAKHNLFTPGDHIPVLPSSAIYDRKPDYVFILAWRYSEPIMNRHQEYIEGGGHFILPWPEIQIK
jgi:NAD(P)-dependent dehydrogenase (short-subunit alcohol dehydrogenase family)